MKIWRPDTCGCAIEELYENETIIGGGQVITKCAAHDVVPDEELYGVLYANPDGENKMKNLMHRALLGYDGLDLGVSEQKMSRHGDVVRELKEGIEFDWSFEGKGKNRKLKVGIKGKNLSVVEKAALRAEGERLFGSKRIDVV